MTRVLNGMRPLLVAVLAIAATLDALGWLYLIRPNSAGAGPPVADALPLDQLAGHDAVALGPFALVWLAVGTVLGLTARASRVRPVTAFLLTGVGVGATALVTTGMSIAFTEQIPVSPALAAAVRVDAVYLAAAFAAAGAILVAARRRGTQEAGRASRRAPATSIRGVPARNSATSVTGLRHDAGRRRLRPRHASRPG